jgi:hypothetical protein
VCNERRWEYARRSKVLGTIFRMRQSRRGETSGNHGKGIHLIRILKALPLWKALEPWDPACRSKKISELDDCRRVLSAGSLPSLIQEGSWVFAGRPSLVLTVGSTREREASGVCTNEVLLRSKSQKFWLIKIPGPPRDSGTTLQFI